MNCPTCHGDKSHVTRTARSDVAIDRDRQCVECGFRWRTVEWSHADWDRARQALELAGKLQRLAPEG